MNINAQTLRRLSALNLPTEAFQEVLSIIADLQASDETRREKSRQRTSVWRKHASELKLDGYHGDVTVTSLSQLPSRHGDARPPPSKVPPITPLNTPPLSSKPKRVSRTAGKCAMPDDWSPDVRFAEARGLTEAQIETEAQRFRDHAAAKGRRCANWDAAWRNWVTSPFQTQGKANGKRTVQEAIRDLRAKVAEFRDGEEDGFCDEARPAPPRLLSQG